MKGTKTRRIERKRDKALEVDVPSSKTVRGKSGEMVRQYPASVGYHGKDNEEALNPEE